MCSNTLFSADQDQEYQLISLNIIDFRLINKLQDSNKHGSGQIMTMMSSKKMASTLLRPSSVLAVTFVLLALCGTSMKVSGNPLPADEKGVGENIKDQYDQAKTQAQDFFERAKNTFSGKADAK
jgi:hypothetical protein